MKKTISLILCIAMAVSMFAMTAAFAVDDNMVEEDVITEEESARSSSHGYNVTDNAGNKYYLLGYVTSAGAKATIYTGFEITNYAESMNQANNRSKNLTANGTAYYGLLGTAVSFGGSEGRSGATNHISYTKTAGGTVGSVVGDHAFSCNGASKTWPTDLVPAG